MPPDKAAVSNSKLTISSLTAGLTIQKESMVKLKASMQDLGDQRLTLLLEQVKLDGLQRVDSVAQINHFDAEQHHRQAEVKLKVRTVESDIARLQAKIKSIDDSIAAVEGFFKSVFQNRVLNKLPAAARLGTGNAGAKTQRRTAELISLV